MAAAAAAAEEPACGLGTSPADSGSVLPPLAENDPHASDDEGNGVIAAALAWGLDAATEAASCDGEKRSDGCSVPSRKATEARPLPRSSASDSVTSLMAHRFTSSSSSGEGAEAPERSCACGGARRHPRRASTGEIITQGDEEGSAPVELAAAGGQLTARLQRVAAIAARTGTQPVQPSAAAPAAGESTLPLRLRGLPSQSEADGQCRVLVVEASDVAWELLRHMLQSPAAGFSRVERARSGREALEALAASTTALPDVVLLAAALREEGEGRQTLCAIREVLNESELPIITMVGRSTSPGDFSAGLPPGFVCDYVDKPPRPAELIARVTMQLRMRQAARLNEEAALLRRMLPGDIIARLGRGEVVADEHACVSCLFADVVGFTSLCAECPAPVVLDFLNSMFEVFDTLAVEHGVHKVTTIGDGYFAVCGQHAHEAGCHAVLTLAFAEALIGAAERMRLPGPAGGALRVRVGLHCGPVQAGVVGSVVPQYSIFGDTVNTASRMESHGFPNAVHMSAEARAVLVQQGMPAERFAACRVREIKGKGRMQTFVLKAGPGSSWEEALEGGSASAA